MSSSSVRSRSFALGIGMLVAVGFVAVPLAVASNAGTVKVHDPEDNGEPKNDPHVGCSFFVEGFNMDATNGTITFKVWPPSGNKTVVHATGSPESWTADDTNKHGNHHFLSGPFSLPAIGNATQGTHYKVFVSDEEHDKTKVFWVNCPEESVPFFPTGASLAMGVLGAAGVILVAATRRT